MKKKMFSVVLFFVSVFVMVGCVSNSSEIEGKYYSISDYSSDLEMTISGDSGSIGEYAITKVDSKKGQITISGDLGERTYNFEYNDGKAVSPLRGYDIYKKGSKAFDEAMKKYGYTEADLEE